MLSSPILPAHTTPPPSHLTTSNAIGPTLGPEVVRLVLDDPPARVRQGRPVVLQHVAVLGQHECPVTATDTTSAAAAEVSDVVDRLEGLLGLARGT